MRLAEKLEWEWLRPDSLSCFTVEIKIKCSWNLELVENYNLIHFDVVMTRLGVFRRPRVTEEYKVNMTNESKYTCCESSAGLIWLRTGSSDETLICTVKCHVSAISRVETK
jgi:hypothetical protein